MELQIINQQEVLGKAFTIYRTADNLLWKGVYFGDIKQLFWFLFVKKVGSEVDF